MVIPKVELGLRNKNDGNIGFGKATRRDPKIN